jgi:predicted DNA-binding protein (MmcQ/YjbR family)
MSVEAVRRICRALPAVTEDIKWGSDLVFSVGGKMFTVVNMERPHTVAFKCTPEMFAELTERDGIIPAPYLARAMWVRERSAGEVLERRELTDLIKTSYELVVATLPKSKRPGAAQKAPKALKRPKKKPARTDRSGRGR